MSKLLDVPVWKNRCKNCGFPCYNEFHDAGSIFCTRRCQELAALLRAQQGARMQFPWMAAIAVWMLVGLFAYAVWPGKARAHDIYSNPEWRQPDNKVSCCNENDCGPSRALFDIEQNMWKAWNPAMQIWVYVPWSKVLKIPSPDGRTHWCGVGGTTYCFVVGDVKS